MNKTKQAIIKITDINIHGGTQQRERIDPETVAEYAEAMRCGAQFPAVVVFNDGITNWLADGFHRFHARREVPAPEILAEVHVGTQRDAILYSTGANNNHGQRLSNADKRKAVGIMLADKEWSQWSDRDIAKHCKVTHPMVSKMRAEKSAAVVTVTTAEPKAVPAIEVKKEETAENVIQLNADQAEFVQDYELEEAREAIRSLSTENEQLKDRLAIGSTDEPEEAKATVLRTMEELREQIRCLEIENAAIKASRNHFQSENAELKKQVAYWRKQAEKAA